MGLSFDDKSEEPPSIQDVREAKHALQKVFVQQLMKLPPELAVQLPNAIRCLQFLEEIHPRK